MSSYGVDVLHLTELTRLSNTSVSAEPEDAVLHLTELTRLSNLK